MSPYRHPAPMPELTARHWTVSEWQKVVVRLMHWIPGTRAHARWKAVQAKRRQVGKRWACWTRMWLQSRNDYRDPAPIRCGCGEHVRVVRPGTTLGTWLHKDDVL